MTNTLNKIMHNGDEYLLPSYSAGTNIQISASNQISATDTTYSAGTGLSLTGTTFANTGVTSVNNHTGAVTVNEVPSGGSIGQLLTRTGSGPAWMNGIMERVASLDAADWSNKEQTVNVVGITASNIVIVSPDPANINDYASNSVYCSAQGSGTLTFKCNTVPSVDINVNILTIN